jgi:imidazole glycerol-phosphate synthase subunit HisF
MFRPRIIPCLLLKEKGLVKTIRFREPRYIGDPINAVRIFNEKDADELVFLDIMASRGSGIPGSLRSAPIAFELIAKISRECMMPLSYGGGITTTEEIKKLFGIGVEKVIINTQATENPEFIREASEIFGNQSIIVSIDAKKNPQGKYEVFIRGGTKATGKDPVQFAKDMVAMGAGELMINSIDQDGMMTGYDIGLVKLVADAVSVPVIACGGAGKIEDFFDAYENGHASAMAAGSLFIFHGRKRAVLINYPTRGELETLFSGTKP